MWFEAPPAQRLVAWRQWREGLTNRSPEEIAGAVAHAWGAAPQVSHYLAPDETHSWPTPWQLIHDNVYCDLACTLGMFYSIALLPEDLTPVLRIYVDNSGWINLLSLQHEKYILNWNHATVVNTITTMNPVADLPLAFQYTKADLANKF